MEDFIIGCIMFRERLVSRRVFIKQCLSASAGMGIISIIPFPLSSKCLPPLHNDISITGLPYWLEVFSRGVPYIPVKARMDIIGWDNEALRAKAYSTLRVAFKQNEGILLQKTRRSAEEMGLLIDKNKSGQFLLEHTKGQYPFSKGVSHITFHEDPVRARIFYELSSIVMKHILEKVDKDQSRGFTVLDVKLLRSAEGYLREGIRTNEKAIAIFPDRLRKTLRVNIGIGYNNLGLALNLLGDIKRAYEMYCRALKWNPNNGNIAQNMDAVHENGTYIQWKPLQPH